MCLRVAFLLITRLASWLRLSQREETWKTAEILILRHRKRGTSRYYACTYPSRKAIKAVTVKVKAICRRNASQPLQILIRQLNPEKRGWCAYFRPGVSAATFADLARGLKPRIESGPASDLGPRCAALRNWAVVVVHLGRAARGYVQVSWVRPQ